MEFSAKTYCDNRGAVNGWAREIITLVSCRGMNEHFRQVERNDFA